MKFFTVERISKARSFTPEGFMVCEGTPIARIGTQEYGMDEFEDSYIRETGIEGDDAGRLIVYREPAEVFRPATVASVNGKSFVNDHPMDDVDPDNWKQLTGGFLINPRRGEGMLDALLLADLIICDRDFIELVNEGKKELSCGYDADYEPISRGKARQKNIVINHVALVDSGRCGPRCAIGDHQRYTMTRRTSKRGKILDWLRRAARAGDDAEKLEEMANDAAEELEEGAGEGEDLRHHGGDGGAGETHIHLGGEGAGDGEYCGKDEFEAHVAKNDDEHKKFHDRISALEQKVGAEEHDAAEEQEIEGEMEEEAPPGTGDKAKASKDSQYLGDSMQSTVADAEVIAPGIRIPSFDAKAPRKQTLDAIHGLRREALRFAYGIVDTRTMIEDVMGNRPFDLSKMTKDSVRYTFRTVAAIKRRANNDAGRNNNRDNNSSGGGTGVKGVIQSPADLNRIFRERRGVSH